MKRKCPFCQKDIKKLTKKIFIEDPKTRKSTDRIKCDRGVYENEHCFAILAPEQISIGHTLLILKRHAKDMSDDVTDEEYINLCKAIRDISNLMKCNLPCVERIYVSSLCDGVEHLHFHLIPRYKTDVKGFNFLGDREKLYNIGVCIGPTPKYDWRLKSFKARAKWIAKIAEKIRGK